VRLYLIGSGTPTPTRERFGTCYVVQVGDDHLMFDCGPATTHKLVKAGLFPTQIDHLFFTHHHYDHNVDYPCFLMTRWNHQTGRESQLRVWGPHRTEWITERLIGAEGAFSDDWKARTQHAASLAEYVEGRGIPEVRPGPEVDVRDIGPGKVTEGTGWSVTAAEAKHYQPFLESLAYRLDSDEGSVVFSGDTLPYEPVSRLARGADTLVVTCWSHQEEQDRGPVSVGGTTNAARLAQEAQVKRLVISHTHQALTRPGSKEKGIVDIGHIFAGEIIFGHELMILEL
jgi:ribonuclease Z